MSSQAIGGVSSNAATSQAAGPVGNWSGKTVNVDYDPAKYPFARHVAQHLNIYDLSRTHELADYPLFKRETDQKTMFHKKFYTIGDDFYAVYRRFIKEVAEPYFGEPLVFQKIPTFRVHLPNNLGVGEFHRDRDYNHQRSEINIWLPLTNAWDTNSVYIETAEDRKDYQPQKVNYGQVLVFDGANLKHGNQINTTGSTRVSFDFRVIPKSRYTEGTGTSVNTNIAFKIGGYYTE